MTTSPDSMETPSAKSSAPSQRLMSIDALRGFDMLWITGVDGFVYALRDMSRNKVTDSLAYELSHSDWEGFRFYDLIFPLFIFIAGVSLVFSLGKIIEKAGRCEALKRIFCRSLLIYALGIFYYGGLSNSWGHIRWTGVLPRIALCYFFAGLLFCFFKPRKLVIICAGLLIGYWAMMTFIPFPNYSVAASDPAATQMVHGSFTKDLNLANYIDLEYLPGRRWFDTWDPEGYLSTMPAIATCLLGVFASLLLQSKAICDKWKLIYLVSFGAGGVLLGWLWNLEFPVIKLIWTSSFALVAAGYSTLLLAAFYLVVDVLKYQKWCQPFVWVGMNAITIYMVDNILGGYTNISKRFLGGDIRSFFDHHMGSGFGEAMIQISGVLVAFLFARFLYKRKLFLRV